MFTKLRVLLEVIDRHYLWLNECPNGLQIANEYPCGWSRATTYRWLDKAMKMGLISRYDCGDHYEWYVNASGRGFIGEWNELPF